MNDKTELQIVEGKFYRTRDGQKAGPMRQTSPSIMSSSEEEGGVYTVVYKDTGRANRNGGDDCDWDLIAEWQDEPAGPVRTVTRREIVPGVYDRVWVGRYPDGTFKGRPVLVALIEHDEPNPDFPPFLAAMNADELRSAAMVLSQLAKALDEVKP